MTEFTTAFTRQADYDEFLKDSVGFKIRTSECFGPCCECVTVTLSLPETAVAVLMEGWSEGESLDSALRRLVATLPREL
jgi:hypothetical protein